MKATKLRGSEFCPLAIVNAMMTAMPGNSPPTQLLTRLSLLSGSSMPIFYYGGQLAAAPFYPGYSFANQVASMLGTSYSSEPWIFNTALILTGLAAILGAFGLYQTFRVRTTRLIGLLIALTAMYTGYMSVKAGIYPLPDHHHFELRFAATSASLTPLLMLIGLWGNERLRALRAYLFLSVVLLIPVILLSKKLIVIDIGVGTLQRLLALGTYVPVGVVSLYFFVHDRPGAGRNLSVATNDSLKR
jgi:hypothetical membrane protein